MEDWRGGLRVHIKQTRGMKRILQNIEEGEQNQTWTDVVIKTVIFCFSQKAWLTSQLDHNQKHDAVR